LPCCLPYGKAGGLQILCCQGINVTDYNFNLDALALKHSDFCNVRDKTRYCSHFKSTFGIPVTPNRVKRMHNFCDMKTPYSDRQVNPTAF
ncbi:MAG: hypothetical protein PVH85_11425, partial [Desulfobacterales bacterium]